MICRLRIRVRDEQQYFLQSLTCRRALCIGIAISLVCICSAKSDGSTNAFAKGLPSLSRLRAMKPATVSASFAKHLKNPVARLIYCKPIYPEKSLNYSAASTGLIVRALLLRKGKDFGAVRRKDGASRIKALLEIIVAVSTMPFDEVQRKNDSFTVSSRSFFAISNLTSQLTGAVNQSKLDKDTYDKSVWKDINRPVTRMRIVASNFISSHMKQNGNVSVQKSKYSSDMREIKKIAGDTLAIVNRRQRGRHQ